MPAHLSLDGHAREYEFPDLKSCSDVKCDENLFGSLKDLVVGSSEATMLDSKQIEHLQEELENQKSKVQAKDSSIQCFKSRIESKE